MSRAAAIFLLTLLMPAIAAGQDTVELTETQRGFNEKGVAAIRDGDYPLAISSFQSSLTLGEANIIYLNLGRAYQRDGNCMKAKEFYAQVADAPPVAAPSRDEILAVTEKYAGELPDLCPATVNVRCDDPQTRVAVDSGEGQACGAVAEFEVVPGTHKLEASLADQTIERDLAVEEGEVVEVMIAFPTESAEREPEPTAATTPDPGLVAAAKPSKRSPLRTIGLVAGAVGASGLTAGFILDYAWVRTVVQPCTTDGVGECEFDKAQNARAANGVVFAVGGGLAIGGLILYLAGGSSDSGVGLQFNRGPGIAWTTRF